MSDSTHTLADFKQMLSDTFNPNPSEDLNEGFDDDYEMASVTAETYLDDGFDDFETGAPADSPADTVVTQMSASTAVDTVDLCMDIGIRSVQLQSKPATLHDEIQNAIYNLGFTEDSCIADFNDMYNANWTSMEEIYSQILYNNYFKRVTVTDINALSVSDLLTDVKQKGSDVGEIPTAPVVKTPSRIEQELNAVEYHDFIKQAVQTGRITDAAYERYGDLYKALYVVDYFEAFGEELTLGDNSDVIYSIMVGRYLGDMSEVDYKKIMYLVFTTDMWQLIEEKGSVDSFADITCYKLSKLVNSDIELDECQKFYIARNHVIMGYNIELIWHNSDEFLSAVGGCSIDVSDGLPLFYDESYKGEPIPSEIQCESSLTSFVARPTLNDDFFYYNYNKLLDMVNQSDLDIPDSVCDFLSEMSDLDIAHYDCVFGNIAKYNPELLGIFTSRYFKVLLGIMRYLPGREPTSYANYRLLSFALLRIFKRKTELASKNMTTELGRDSASIDVIGIANINLLSFEEFWSNFDSILTYMTAASKITISIFNSIARLKIE